MNPKKDIDDDEEETRNKTRSTSGQRIPQHKHCMICNKAIPAKESLCSDECEDKYRALESKRRNYMYIMYALLVFVFVMVIFVRV